MNLAGTGPDGPPAPVDFVHRNPPSSTYAISVPPATFSATPVTLSARAR